MKAKKTKKKKPHRWYAVDIPLIYGDWDFVRQFSNKKSAIQYCKKYWHADSKGNVCLITECS